MEKTSNNSKAIDPYQKVCKYTVCNSSFTATRTDQEYCCREHKIKANNADAKAIRVLVGPTEKQSRKNLRILDEFFKAGIIEVGLRDLEFNGFNYSVSTGTVLNSVKSQYIFAYHNYALEPLHENKYKIIKK